MDFDYLYMMSLRAAYANFCKAQIRTVQNNVMENAKLIIIHNEIVNARKK